MYKKSLKDVKINNTLQVLKYILEEEPVSRIEISEKANLSPSTVSQAASFLLENEIIEEVREGESTGGRKPILLQVRAVYGCIVTVDIFRDGVKGTVFDLSGGCLCQETLSKKYISGNRLLDRISDFIKEIQKEESQLPRKIVGIGLMCQDDLPEYDLMTEFSTSLSADIIRLETALTSRCGIPVKKELLNRYSLNYYLNEADVKCTDYAYINIGQRITASFVLNQKMVHTSEDSIFDVSSAVLSGNYAGMPGQERMTRKVSPEVLADKLIQVIKSALLFFPVNDIFIGGQVEEIDKIIEKVSGEFQIHPVIRKVGEPGRKIENVFARQILTENYRSIIAEV